MPRVIVEGMDCVGKTTVAELISIITGLPYIKIKKTVNNGCSEFETTQAIINEISDKVGENWSGVLDRGFHSSVAGAIIRDYNTDYHKLQMPNNLIADIGFLVVSSKESILRRNTKPLTYQDYLTLSSDKFDEIQSNLITDCKNKGYSLIENHFSTKEGLYYNILNKLMERKIMEKQNLIEIVIRETGEKKLIPEHNFQGFGFDQHKIVQVEGKTYHRAYARENVYIILPDVESYKK